MKTKTIILAASLAFTGLSSSNATVWTVNNNTNSPGQYTDLQTAIADIANIMDGDTLYVHGSYVSYGNITLNRPLVLIGTGFSPDKDNPLVSELGSVSLGANGSKIIGFYLNPPLSSYAIDGSGIQNIEISRNKFSDLSGWSSIQLNSGSSDWLINGNVFFREINVLWASNILFKNNIFASQGYIVQSDKSDVVINNNFFLDGTAFGTIINANINNNIFYFKAPLGCDNCSFNNNLTFSTAQDVLPYGTNTGANNIIITSTDSLFVNVTPGDFIYNETYDYHLDNISPGKNAGNDGTDIGNYGSFPPFIDSGMPSIPQVIRMNIINNVISQNDTLQINIKAKWQE